MPGIDVPPAVSHDIAPREIDRPSFRCLEYHAGFWLSTVAIIGIGVKADLDIVNRKLSAQEIVHGFDDVAALLAGGDIRLVGDDDQGEARLAQGGQCLQDFGEDFEFLDSVRRIGRSVPHMGPYQNAIAI
jgi:hypothetical protein